LIKADALQRHWRPLVLLFWLATAIYMIWGNRAGIQSFALGDTDDNLRIMQVRAWLLGGQDWYDLRQYRLSPPEGLNIHWSRIVDLPIAGLYLLLTPFMGGAAAERWAVGLAPLLPLAILMLALAGALRRLLSPWAYWLAPALMLFAGSALFQFSPLRIDHHGWQLAMLALGVLGIADPQKARGGLTLGIASGVSLAIGLENAALPRPRRRRDGTVLGAQPRRGAAARRLRGELRGHRRARLPAVRVERQLAAHVRRLVAGVAVGGAARGRRRGGAGLAQSGSLWLRLGAAAVGGALVAGMYAYSWPHCLGRLENVPEELDRFWLSNVREAMPIWRHDTATAVAIATLPAIGLIGYLLMLWRTRREPEVLQRWLACSRWPRWRQACSLGRPAPVRPRRCSPYPARRRSAGCCSTGSPISG
jgi:hypothetical protein